MIQNDKLDKYSGIYLSELVNNIIPFWEKNCPDREFGAYFTCLDRDGSVYDTEKFMWMQWRIVWMFCELYTKLERKEEWIRIAESGFRFLTKHGKDEKGRYYFSLARDGRPTVSPYSVFSECFAVMGSAAYYRATGDTSAKAEALRAFDEYLRRENCPKGEWTKELSGRKPMRSLGFYMMKANLYVVLQECLEDIDFDADLLQTITTVLDLGIIAHSAKKTVGDSGCSPRPPCDLNCAIHISFHVQETGGTLDDFRQLLGRVVVHVAEDAEPIPERRREHPGAGSRSHQGKPLKRNLESLRVSTLVEHEIDLEVFHRGVEELLDYLGEAVNLIDKEDIPNLQAGENSHHILGAFQRRTGCGDNVRTHRAGDDVGQGGFPKPRCAVKEYVFERFAPVAGGGDGDLHVLHHGQLTDIFIERLRAEVPYLAFIFEGNRADYARLAIILIVAADNFFSCHKTPPPVLKQQARKLKHAKASS